MRQLSSELVELQETLYNSSNPTRRWLHISRRDRIFDYIDRYLKPGSVAMEVGPGSGIYLPRLCDRAERVYATDIESDYLKHAESIAQQYSNLELLIDDITDSSITENSVDLVLCTEVIEHIADEQAVFRGFRKILKPGGYLVLSTPQKYSPLELAAKVAFLPGIIEIVRRIYREPILETGHINLMTESMVINLIQEARFTLKESDKSGMYVPMLAEFFGEGALTLEQKMEKLILGTWFDWLLWTQYHVAQLES